MTFSRPVLPPAMLGILGGGQLGRYFVMAARTMGYRTMVLEPDALAPVCAVVTNEFENPSAIEITQDRRSEKRFL